MGRALLQALRHRWDGYRRFKPSLELPTSYGSLKDDTPDNAWGRSVYPFSVLPDALLSVGDAFAARTPTHGSNPGRAGRAPGRPCPVRYSRVRTSPLGQPADFELALNPNPDPDPKP